MTAGPGFVIVGGGMTAASAAHTLRGEGYAGGVTIVGTEERLPYERPPLSKEVLRGERPAEDTTFLDAGWYRDNGVDLRLGVPVASVDPSARRVVLADGSSLGYESLLIATGGANRSLRVAGAELEGVLGLRSVDDAEAIRRAATPGARAAIVGAGFIGSEVAASLRHLDVEVEIIEFFDLPLVRVLGPEVARVYESLHREHGVRFHFGQAADRFEGRTRVEAVVTKDGTTVGCDFAVVGVGISPVTGFLDGSGIEVDNGVLVDERCRTNVPNVFAAGDVANHQHPLFGRRLRVEHFDNALKQGAAAARSMLGQTRPFDDPHWFWSDQYDTNLQYLGFATEWDELVVRGSLQGRDFVGFYVKGGVVLAAVGMNRGKDVRRAAGLIRSRRPVDARALADEDVDLRKLAAAAPVASREGAMPWQG